MAAATEEGAGRNDGLASPSSPAENGSDPAAKPPKSLLPRSGSSQNLLPMPASASASASTSSGEEDLPRSRPAGEEPPPGGRAREAEEREREKPRKSQARISPALRIWLQHLAGSLAVSQGDSQPGNCVVQG